MTHITGSFQNDNGLVVEFSNGYWVFGIKERGNANYPPQLSMFYWIRHLRDKNWWNVELENLFIENVTSNL